MVTERVRHCPICDSPGSPYGERDDAGVLVKVDKCAGCGTIYHNPRLKRDALDKFYQDGTYFNKYSRGNSQDRVNRIITTLRLMEIKPKRVLDVGCANGNLLKNIQIWFGSQVLGIDPFPGTPLVKEIVTSKDEVDGEFDLITCLHVLEHMYDPQAELDWMVKKLAPGGTILIEIPTREKFMFPHVYIFSEKAIRLMVDRTEMECMYINHAEAHVAQAFIGDGWGKYRVERVIEGAPEISYRGLYGFE